MGWASLALLAYLAYIVVGPFLAPLGWAAVFAIVAHPVFARLQRRWGRGLAALAGTAVIAVAVIVPALAVTAVIAAEAIDVSASIQRALLDGRASALAGVWTRLSQVLGDDVGQTAAELVRRGAETLVAWSGLALRDAVVFGVNVVVALFATFFLLRDGDAIMQVVRSVLPMPAPLREDVIVRVQHLVTAGVMSSALVAAVQGVLGGLSFWVLGLPSPAFWAVVMGLLCLLPFGAWVVWLPAALALAMNGEIGRATALAAMGLVVVSGVDNVLRPALVSGRARMHGLVIFIGLLGGAAAWGALGLVVGPVVLATALALLTAHVDAAHHEAPTPDNEMTMMG